MVTSAITFSGFVNKKMVLVSNLTFNDHGYRVCYCRSLWFRDASRVICFDKEIGEMDHCCCNFQNLLEL